MVYWIPRIITPNTSSSSNSRKVPTNEYKQGNNAFNYELLSIGTESCYSKEEKENKIIKVMSSSLGVE